MNLERTLRTNAMMRLIKEERPENVHSRFEVVICRLIDLVIFV